MKLIKEAGFKYVRVPIRWSAHAAIEPPYTVDPKFFARVDQVVNQALDNKLLVILNMHHYEELETALDQHQERFRSIWHQIAQHFKRAPEDVAFEIYNEPCKQISDERWNQLYPAVVQDIRKLNPDRVVVVGPVNWNNINNELKT